MELAAKEAEYMASSEDFFKKITGTWTDKAFEKEPAAYEKVLPPAMVYGINGAEGFLKNKKRLLTWS